MRIRLLLAKAFVSYSAETANFQTTFLLPREADNFFKETNSEERNVPLTMHFFADLSLCQADPITTTEFTDKNDFPVIGDVSFEERIVGLPGGKHCKSI